MCASKREKLAAMRSMHELRRDGGAECAQRESISRIWLNLVHSRASKFDGDRATWSMQSGKKPVAARLEWPRHIIRASEKSLQVQLFARSRW